MLDSLKPLDSPPSTRSGVRSPVLLLPPHQLQLCGYRLFAHTDGLPANQVEAGEDKMTMNQVRIR